MTMVNMEKRNVALDFWKFCAALIIALLHFDWRIVPHGYLSVEFFLVVAGYLIYCNKDKYKINSIFSIAVSKLKTVYFYWIILLTLGLICRLYSSTVSRNLGTWGIRILKMLFFIPYLFETTVTSPDSFWVPWGQMWYIPVWFVDSLIAIAFVKIRNKTISKYIIVSTAILLTGIVYNATDNHMLNMSQEMAIGSFPFGVIRGLQDITLGLVVGIVCEEIVLYLKSAKIELAGKIMFSLIDGLIIIGMGIIYFMSSVTPEVDYIYIVFSYGLIILSVINVDYINSFLRKLSGGGYRLFSLSPAVYFFHYLVVYVFKSANVDTMKWENIGIYILVVIVVAWIGAKCEVVLRKSCEHLWDKMIIRKQ